MLNQYAIVTASENAPGFQGEDSLCYSLWPLPVRVHAIWIVQCAGHIPAIDGIGASRVGAEDLYGLHTQTIFSSSVTPSTTIWKT